MNKKAMEAWGQELGQICKEEVKLVRTGAWALAKAQKLEAFGPNSVKIMKKKKKKT